MHNNRGNHNQPGLSRLSEFKAIIKENDEFYREIAKQSGLSDCAFWILYSLREKEEAVTQSDLCNMLYQPKQTVNSALKKLEAAGMLILGSESGSRSKPIYLTDKGENLAAGTVDKVIAMEREALSDLSIAEQEVFLSLFHKFTGSLRDKFQDLFLLDR